MKNYESVPKEYNGIKLRLDWFFLSPLRFILVESCIHEDNCAMWTLQGWDEDNCNCTPTPITNIVGKLLPFRTNGPDDDKKFWQVTMPISIQDFEKYVDALNIPRGEMSKFWEMKELWPPFVMEAIENGLIIMYEMLKYYEVTGKQSDHFAIDAKEIEKILYDKS